ncbi:SRPBCC family protein [Dawidia soli]|uniref:SRPBCC family protein n=1 Tax=Dawidia soli TaxID=2782352 RepID=A0AAP2DDE5_9BACT|nr:SRPBCC family protein [Dawidia soli]MBT1688690.1 SRPBCC family protein [Dawidia soli]
MNTTAKRTDSAARVIHATPEAIYAAYLDPTAIATWRPPQGMHCEVFEFNPTPGGSFRMSFGYKETEHGIAGKTTEHADVFHGHFAELIPHQRIVEIVEFESDDPAFGGEMKVTTTLVQERHGTNVNVVCENVPTGITADDHRQGIQSSLANLAQYVER